MVLQSNHEIFYSLGVQLLLFIYFDVGQSHLLRHESKMQKNAALLWIKLQCRLAPLINNLHTDRWWPSPGIAHFTEAIPWNCLLFISMGNDSAPILDICSSCLVIQSRTVWTVYSKLSNYMIAQTCCMTSIFLL